MYRLYIIRTSIRCRPHVQKVELKRNIKRERERERTVCHKPLYPLYTISLLVKPVTEKHTVTTP